MGYNEQNQGNNNCISALIVLALIFDLVVITSRRAVTLIFDVVVMTSRCCDTHIYTINRSKNVYRLPT